MFNVGKIRSMTETLQKFARDYDNVYVIPYGIFSEAEFNLFKRLGIKIIAVMFDTIPQKEIFGIPFIKTAEASANFNERTALIIINKKTIPLIEATFDFKVGDEMLTVPAVIMSVEETKFIYDYLTVLKIMEQYEEDKIDKPRDFFALAERFARGFTTMLNPISENFKVNLWCRYMGFKPTYDFDDTAIVIQGPIAYENNYTAETFKFYRSIYPRVPIIVSTWQGEATDKFRKECANNSVILLESEMPKNRGLGNVNLQLKSSFEGIKYIHDNTSAKFALKIRSDQRINYFNFLVYFKNLLKTFPPKGDKLNQRIIFLGSHDTKGHPFHPHDFLAFGNITDIFKLYDIPLYDNEREQKYVISHWKMRGKINLYVNSNICPFDFDSITEQNHKLYKLNKLMNRNAAPEVYLTRTFYEKYIASVDPTKLYETSWKFMVDYLILIDFDMIKLDWPKYEHMRYSHGFCYGKHNAFAWWLDMYNNFKIDWV